MSQVGMSRFELYQLVKDSIYPLLNDNVYEPVERVARIPSEKNSFLTLGTQFYNRRVLMMYQCEVDSGGSRMRRILS